MGRRGVDHSRVMKLRSRIPPRANDQIPMSKPSAIGEWLSPTSHFLPSRCPSILLAMDKGDAIAMLKAGKVEEWNVYREEHPDWKPDLSEAHLFRAHLSTANLSTANLDRANLTDANLCGANFRKARLHGAILNNTKKRKGDITDYGGLRRPRWGLGMEVGHRDHGLRFASPGAGFRDAEQAARCRVMSYERRASEKG